MRLMFLIAVLCVGAFLVGCNRESASKSSGPAEVAGRTTPLREEVDEVAPIREKFRRITGGDEK